MNLKDTAPGSAVPVDLPRSTEVDRQPAKVKPSPTWQDEVAAQKAHHARVIAQAKEDMKTIYRAP